MKYKKEFEEELKLCLNDLRTVQKYSAEHITETLFEYWSMKDHDPFPPMFKPEYYEDINKFMDEVSTMTAKQKKVLSQFLIKKLKYMERTNG